MAVEKKAEISGKYKRAKLEGEFTDKQKQINIHKTLVDDLIEATKITLEPNSSKRKKLWKGLKKRYRPKQIFSNEKDETEQLDSPMGNIMYQYGKLFGQHTELGDGLVYFAIELRQMAYKTYEFENKVKFEFVDALNEFKTTYIEKINEEIKSMKKHRTLHEYKLRKNKLNPNKTSKFMLKKTNSYHLMESFLNDASRYFNVFKTLAQLNFDYHQMQADKFNEIKNHFQNNISENIYDGVSSEFFKEANSINDTMSLENNCRVSTKTLNDINKVKTDTQRATKRSKAPKSDTISNSLCLEGSTMSRSETF